MVKKKLPEYVQATSLKELEKNITGDYNTYSTHIHTHTTHAYIMCIYAHMNHMPFPGSHEF